MYIYTSRKGEKQGPFTICRITEMIDAGDLSLDDPAWHEGLDEWLPIKEISVITSTLESLNKKGGRLDENAEDDTNVDVFPYWEHLEANKHQTDGSEEDGNEDVRLPASPFRFKPSLPLPSSDPDNNKVSTPARAPTVHPFLRFWARFFDYLLLNLFVWFIFTPPQIPPLPDGIDNLFEFLRSLNELIPQEEQVRITMIQGGSLFAWNFIETLLISSFGTTPGKMLFNIRVTRKSGSRLHYMEAMTRSMIVWILGIGIGITFCQIVAMTIALFYLLNKGETLWDQLLKIQVHHRPLGPQKIILAVGAYLVLLSLQGYLFS